MPQITEFVGDLNVTKNASPIFLMTFPPCTLNIGSAMLSNRSCKSENSSRVSLAVVLVYPTMSMNITVRTSDGIIGVLIFVCSYWSLYKVFRSCGCFSCFRVGDF